MKTMAGNIMLISLLGWLLGLWCLTPGHTFPVSPPPENLAGLTPGINTVADASRLYGVYNVALPGKFLSYVGGPHSATGYRWTNGVDGRVPGLIVETAIGSPVIEAVVVDEYPGLATSYGLTALVPEQYAVSLYGIPNFAYEITTNCDEFVYRELYFIDRGLMVVLSHAYGRPGWTVSSLILTYPTYLRNAVSRRYRYALNGLSVEDITESYRTWISLSAPAQ